MVVGGFAVDGSCGDDEDGQQGRHKYDPVEPRQGGTPERVFPREFAALFGAQGLEECIACGTHEEGFDVWIKGAHSPVQLSEETLASQEVRVESPEGECGQCTCHGEPSIMIIYCESKEGTCDGQSPSLQKEPVVPQPSYDCLNQVQVFDSGILELLIPTHVVRILA